MPLFCRSVRAGGHHWGTNNGDIVGRGLFRSSLDPCVQPDPWCHPAYSRIRGVTLRTVGSVVSPCVQSDPWCHPCVQPDFGVTHVYSRIRGVTHVYSRFDGVTPASSRIRGVTPAYNRVRDVVATHVTELLVQQLLSALLLLASADLQDVFCSPSSQEHKMFGVGIEWGTGASRNLLWHMYWAV